MNDEELQAIKDELDKITPNPWKASGCYVLTPLGVLIVQTIKLTDAEFIAKAPERISALLAEVEKLRAVLETVRDPWYSSEDHIGTGDEGCPDNPCPACHRQEAEARRRAVEALYGDQQ